MQNFISFVNEYLIWEEDSPHRHDCHDPPHALRVDFMMIDPHCEDWLRWQVRPLEDNTCSVGFRGDATRRRRLPWVMGSGLSATTLNDGWCIRGGGIGCFQLERSW